MIGYRILEIQKTLPIDELFFMINDSWKNETLCCPVLGKPYDHCNDYVILPATNNYVVIVYTVKIDDKNLLILSLCNARDCIFDLFNKMITENHYIKKIIDESKKMSNDLEIRACAEKVIEIYYQELLSILTCNEIL